MKFIGGLKPHLQHRQIRLRGLCNQSSQGDFATLLL
jgi:hypothetical protein